MSVRKPRALWLSMSLLAVAVVAGGCEANYTTVRFRPVDTTSQLTLEGVRVLVSRVPGEGVLRGTTTEHGQVDVAGLRAGDTVTLVKPGYEPTTLEIGLGSFVQRSPSVGGNPVLFELRELDAVPVPMHREGSVRRPGTTQTR